MGALLRRLAIAGAGVGAFLYFHAVVASAHQTTTPTASVSGRVIDASTARPLAGVKVALQGRTHAPASCETDSTGQFTFSSVTPGVQIVEAVLPYYHMGYLGSAEPDHRWFFELSPGEARKDQVVRLSRWARLSGHVYDNAGKPLARVRITAFVPVHWSGVDTWNWGPNTMTDDAGGYVLDDMSGTHVVMAGWGEPEKPSSLQPDEALPFPPTFFPSALEPDGATRFNLLPGTELPGVDFVLKASPSASVVAIPPKPPSDVATESVWMMRPEWCRGIGCYPLTRQATAGTDGSATLKGVPPGRYVLDYQLRTPAGGRGDIVTPPAVTLSSVEQEVVVAGRDVRVELHPISSLDITGRVMLPAVGLPTPPAVCVMSSVPSMPSREYCISVGASESFRVASIRPGEYVATVRSTSSAFLAQAIVGGIDVTDRPFRLTASSEMTVRLTARPAQLSGAIAGPSDTLLQTWVVVFPADPALWTRFGPEPRRFRKIMLTNGRFTFAALPAGDYWVAAVADDLHDDSTWQFPERLRALLAVARRVFLAEGSTSTIDLKAAAPAGK